LIYLKAARIIRDLRSLHVCDGARRAATVLAWHRTMKKSWGWHMNSIRSVAGLLLALAFATLAGPALANNKAYTLAVTPGAVATGANVPMRAVFTNVSPTGGANSSFNSVRLDAPPGYEITKVTGKSSGVANIVQSGGAIEVTGMSPVGKNGTFWIEFEATVPATCGASPWNPNVTGDVWTGSSLSGTSFGRQGDAPTTSVTGTLSLAFVASSLPTSVAEGTPFTVTVNQQSSCAGPLPPVQVTLSATGAAFTGSSALTSGGTVSLTGTFNATGNSVTIVASAPGYAPATSSAFTVFAEGDLKCPDITTNPAETQFSASPTGVTNVSQTAYAAGFRGLNVVKPDGVDCEPVNYTFVNNVLGDGPGVGGTKTDPKGNTVPANGVSFVWDQTFQPNAAYSYTVTWQPEWFGIGSSANRKTKFCTGTGATACATTQDAQACLSPLLLESSLPGYPGSPAPACVTAEVWVVIAASECASLPAPAGDQTACVRFSTTVTDIFDPVFIR
jgi:hypothetical protein